jgi:hypothetical protein
MFNKHIYGYSMDITECWLMLLGRGFGVPNISALSKRLAGFNYF